MSDEKRGIVAVPEIVKMARTALCDLDDQTFWRTFTAHPDSDPCIAIGIPEAMTLRAALDRLEARMQEPDGFITVEYDRPHYRPTRAYPSCRPFIYIDGGFHE